MQFNINQNHVVKQYWRPWAYRLDFCWPESLETIWIIPITLRHWDYLFRSEVQTLPVKMKNEYLTDIFILLDISPCWFYAFCTCWYDEKTTTVSFITDQSICYDGMFLSRMQGSVPHEDKALYIPLHVADQ